MAIIHQHDKRCGITYVYDSHSYWDKEKKMVRAKRKLIGKLDPQTGEIVPTDGRGRKDKPKKQAEESPDYKALYEKLQKKFAAQEVLLETLNTQLAKLQAGS